MIWCSVKRDDDVRSLLHYFLQPNAMFNLTCVTVCFWNRIITPLSQYLARWLIIPQKGLTVLFCVQPGRRCCSSRSSGRRRPTERSTIKKPLPAHSWTVSTAPPPPPPIPPPPTTTTHFFADVLAAQSPSSSALQACGQARWQPANQGD